MAIDQEQDLPLFKKYAVMNSGLLESSRYNDTIIASFGLIRVSKHPGEGLSRNGKYPDMKRARLAKEVLLLIMRNRGPASWTSDADAVFIFSGLTSKLPQVNVIHISCWYHCKA